jgi:ectoine utilization protein EutC
MADPRDVLILTEAELRSVVDLDLEVIDIVETAFAALGSGDVIMPPILSMAIPAANGEVDVKTAYIPGFEGFAIKVSPGFFDNPKLGLPSLSGLMILLSAKTGLVDALLLDNGYLTDIRTAAAGAVAARYLAPPEVETAAVFGTGVQARLQMRAAHLVRPFSKGIVWGRDRARTEACATDLQELLGIPVRAEPDGERAVGESQLVITTTPAREPIVKAAWLHPGLHITAMGSDAHGKNELEPALMAAADIYVCDRLSQCEKLGELRSAMEAGHRLKNEPTELGDIVKKRLAGRTQEHEITVCDLTGTGAQDTAIASHAVGVAKAGGKGSKVAT